MSTFNYIFFSEDTAAGFHTLRN